MKPLEDQIAELIAGWREYADGHTKTVATCANELEQLLRDAEAAQSRYAQRDMPSSNADWDGGWTKMGRKD